MSEPLTVEQIPEWFKDHNDRLTQVEAELTFLKNLWVLSAYGVKLPRHATRDPRVLPRPRQGGHL
jgi:hypothetical protein